MPDGPEGSPIELVIKRTLTFSDRKYIILGSTADRREETSNVCEAVWPASDQRVFEFVFLVRLAEVLREYSLWASCRMGSQICRRGLRRIGVKHVTRLLASQYKPAMVEAGRWRALANRM